MRACKCVRARISAGRAPGGRHVAVAEGRVAVAEGRVIERHLDAGADADGEPAGEDGGAEHVAVDELPARLLLPVLEEVLPVPRHTPAAPPASSAPTLPRRARQHHTSPDKRRAPR